MLDLVDQVHSQLFPETPRRLLEANLPGVIEALRTAGILTPTGFAVAMGTIRAEVGQFRPISEYPSRWNTGQDGRAFSKYWHNKTIRKSLGNTSLEAAIKYKGRGYIQLTGENNYKAAQGRFGIDFPGNPELANDPAHAASILAWFLERSSAINHAEAGSMKRSRAAVNGGSHGIAAFTATYRKALDVVAECGLPSEREVESTTKYEADGDGAVRRTDIKDSRIVANSSGAIITSLGGVVSVFAGVFKLIPDWAAGIIAIGLFALVALLGYKIITRRLEDNQEGST